MKIHQSANSLPACHHSLIGDNISELWLLVFRSLHVARQDFILLILQVDRHAAGDKDKEEEGEVDLIAGEGGEELDHRHPPSPPLTGSGLDKRSTILGSLGPQTGIRGLKRGVVQAAASHWLEPAATAANKILRTLVKVSGKKGDDGVGGTGGLKKMAELLRFLLKSVSSMFAKLWSNLSSWPPAQCWQPLTRPGECQVATQVFPLVYSCGETFFSQ